MKYQEFTEEYENITNNDLLNKVLWFNGIKNKAEYQAIETNSFPFYFDNTEYFIDMINKHQNNKIIIVGIGEVTQFGIVLSHSDKQAIQHTSKQEASEKGANGKRGRIKRQG